MAAGGLDYVCVDCQHGLVSYEAMTMMVLAISGTPAAPVVRVPANDPAWIGRALDAGAEAVIVPLVNGPDEAARAAAACRFPPDGNRSFGLMRARQALGGDPATANREVMCLPMIETRAGVEAAEAICATPGVDGIYIGPSDLAVSLGLPPSLPVRDPQHAAAVERVRKACENAGIVPGIHARGGEAGRHHAAEGFRMITVAVDVVLLGAGARRELRAAQS